MKHVNKRTLLQDLPYSVKIHGNGRSPGGMAAGCPLRSLVTTVYKCIAKTFVSVFVSQYFEPTLKTTLFVNRI